MPAATDQPTIAGRQAGSGGGRRPERGPSLLELMTGQHSEAGALALANRRQTLEPQEESHCTHEYFKQAYVAAFHAPPRRARRRSWNGRSWRATASLPTRWPP